MKLDFKIGLKNNYSASSGAIARTAMKFWGKIHTLLFFVILLSFAGLGWHIWQQSLSGAGWSDQKKQDYLNSQSKGVSFKEDEFNSAIGQVQARKNEDVSAFQPAKDIFKAY